MPIVQVINILIIYVRSHASRRHDKESICKIMIKALHVDFMMLAVRNTVNLLYHRTCKFTDDILPMCDLRPNYQLSLADDRKIAWAEY